MAWTAPATYTTGQVLTAANLNTYLRDNMKGVGGTDKPMCRAFNSANITVGSASLSVLNLDSERFDTQAMHSTVSNTGRITAPTGWGGIYVFGGGINWQASAAGTKRQLALKLNSATVVALVTIPVPTAILIDMNIHAVYSLAAGDYVEMLAYQDTGGNLNCQSSANNGPEFWGVWQATG